MDNIMQCSPSVADWHVSAVVGVTLCPCTRENKTCRQRSEHDRLYGTRTTEYSEFFKGAKPSRSDIATRLARGWHVLEFAVRKINRLGGV